jgi:signal transduction histidine kinase
MRRHLPASLRWRFLLALMATSAVTLGAVALMVLPPMQDRLRDQSIDNLESAVDQNVEAFAQRLGELEKAGTSRQDYSFEFWEETNQLGAQSPNTRVLLQDRTTQSAALDAQGQGFVYDSEFGPPPARALHMAIVAWLGEPTTEAEGDTVLVSRPLESGGRLLGVLVAERELSEVSTLVGQVRDRFLIAAVVALSIAALLAIALSSTLLRRLARLRGAALRISDEGPEATMPHDERRDEVGDLARALARMQEELRRQEAARRAFVATASHELRTPLTLLQGTMELLEEDIRAGQIDELDALRQVDTARRELDRLSALSGELLDLSRLDAAVPLRSEPVELGEIVRAVAAEFELRARERSTSVEVILPDASSWGHGDPDAVARVVRILLDNALRYGPRGAPVSVEAHATAGEARITVADRGAGIPPEERDRIFERFHRGSAAGSSGGFGLGLAIGRELARRMGGELVVDGDGADGTRFALTLRPARSPAEPPRHERDRVSA